MVYLFINSLSHSKGWQYRKEIPMDLKEARYILAIARHKSIGKAAESLFISQPSLSKYLKNLEQQLGAPLFSRLEQGYVPTYMGERYLYYAEQIAAFGRSGPGI